MKEGKKLSRFKIYITEILNGLLIRPEKSNEIDALIRARKNIGSVITTNYDRLCEKVFEFNPLIGNDILLSNPYGSVYKIHGCVTDSDNIIITRDDYNNFNNKYELIRAQLLSIFIFSLFARLLFPVCSIAERRWPRFSGHMNVLSLKIGNCFFPGNTFFSLSLSLSRASEFRKKFHFEISVLSVC